MSQVFKITNGLSIAEYVSRNMRPDREEVPGRDDLARCADLAALDEMPVCDPPIFPISQKDD